MELALAMFTAVDLGRRRAMRVRGGGRGRHGRDQPSDLGRRPVRGGHAGRDRARRPGPGTINLVVQVPVALDPGAAVNAAITATEAKVQALAARGVPGTGTATDAITVVWPCEGAPERFAGPRSQWGSRIAQAVYRAVWAGGGTGSLSVLPGALWAEWRAVR